MSVYKQELSMIYCGKMTFNQITELSLYRCPLHYAAGHINYECVVSLVATGSNVSKSDTKGCTPLHYAATADADAK